MKFQTCFVLLSALAAATSASRDEDNTAWSTYPRHLQKLPQLDMDSVTNLVNIFGEDILESISENANQWPAFLDEDSDFYPFNELTGFLVPIINELLKFVLSEFDPVDLEINDGVDLGGVDLGFCTADAGIDYSVDPIIGLSELQIFELTSVEGARLISISLDNFRFEFALLFSAGYPEGAIKTGVNTLLSSKICGTSFEFATGGDIILDGPRFDILVNFKGRINFLDAFTKIVVRKTEIAQVLMQQDDTSVLLDAGDFDQNEAAGLESLMGRRLGENIGNNANGQMGPLISSFLGAHFSKLMPLKLKLKN